MNSDLPGLDKVIEKIFELIPAYYDDYTAESIKKLLIDYYKEVLEKGN